MNNKFSQQKEEALKGLAEAKGKGEVDEGMLPLIDYVNSLGEYYTNSTCTGRISVFHDPGSKKDSDWLGKWHGTVRFDQVKEAVGKAPGNGSIWFMHEPTIMHVTCRTADDATRLVDLARNNGYKKVGILSLKEERIIVEVCGTERVDAPVVLEGKLIASDEYIEELIRVANMKFERGMARLLRFTSALKELEER